MDVSKLESKEPVVPALEAVELEGSQLIDTLVTLTGLPENVAHDELDQILANVGNGGSRDELTLNELRQALLLYLETFQPSDVMGEEPLNAAGDAL